MRFAMKAKARRYTVRQINQSAMQAGPAATLTTCAALDALKTAERAEKLAFAEAVRRERARRAGDEMYAARWEQQEQRARRAFDIENVEAQRKARAARMEQRGREILKAARLEQKELVASIKARDGEAAFNARVACYRDNPPTVQQIVEASNEERLFMVLAERERRG